MSEALRPVAWQYTTESGNEHYTAIKAKALQFDANPMPLYAAPTSTAEIRAQALEEVANDMTRSRYAALYTPATRLLRVRAKRIREEAK